MVGIASEMKYGESLSSVPGTPDANSVHCLSTILSIRDSLCFTSTVLALRCCSATGRSCRLSNVAMAAPICSSADVVSLRTTQYQEIQEFVSDVLRIGVLRTWSSVGAASQVCNCFPALAALAQQAFTVQVLLWCCAAQGPQAFCCLQPRSARMSTRSWPHCMELSWLMNGVSLTLLSQNVRLSRDGRLTQFLQLSMISLWAPSRSSWLCHGRCTGLARSELPSSSVGASLAGFGPGPHVLFLLAPGFQGSTRCWHSAPVEFISTLGLLTGKSLFK